MRKNTTVLPSRTSTRSRLPIAAAVAAAILLPAYRQIAGYLDGKPAHRHRSASTRAVSPDGIDPVLRAELAKWTETECGRNTFRSALEEMERHKDVVAEVFEKHGVPEELMAIPVVESGYRNIEQCAPKLQKKKRAAGLWMFEPPTAKAMGLRIGRRTDERYHVRLASEAAAKYLRNLYDRFGDWSLAIAAYNQGPARVAAEVERTGERNVFELARQGALNTYAAKVISAAIVLQNPALLESGGVDRLTTDLELAILAPQTIPGTDRAEVRAKADVEPSTKVALASVTGR